jgi:glycosyltransferase involved in cell wall biosynthesis
LISAEGLAGRVSFAGELAGAALEARYDAADVFVLATLGETYGMAVAEALAHGLPIVATATGAIPDLVGDRAGLVVPPGDVDAMSAALARVISNAGLRTALATGAREVRGRLPTWDAAIDRMSDVLKAVTHD